jgi:hypothetical protein
LLSLKDLQFDEEKHREIFPISSPLLRGLPSIIYIMESKQT